MKPQHSSFPSSSKSDAAAAQIQPVHKTAARPHAVIKRRYVTETGLGNASRTRENSEGATGRKLDLGVRRQRIHHLEGSARLQCLAKKGPRRQMTRNR